jgi:hypothetical protein
MDSFRVQLPRFSSTYCSAIKRRKSTIWADDKRQAHHLSCNRTSNQAEDSTSRAVMLRQIEAFRGRLSRSSGRCLMKLVGAFRALSVREVFRTAKEIAKENAAPSGTASLRGDSLLRRPSAHAFARETAPPTEAEKD